jgi:hypothetical protein
LANDKRIKRFVNDEFSWIRNEHQTKARYFEDDYFKMIGVG